MTTLDQPQIEARLELLTAKAKYFTAELEAQTGQTIKAPALSGDDIILNLEIMEKHCSGLESQFRTAANEPQIPAQSTQVCQGSFLERALKEHGCSTLAELKTKCEVSRLEKLIPRLSGFTLKIVQSKLAAAKAALHAIKYQIKQ
jgi:hypothetical protein